MKTSPLMMVLCLALVGCGPPGPDKAVPPQPAADSATKAAGAPATPIGKDTATRVDAPAPSAKRHVSQLNATCPGDVAVHADEGGPVYINGTQAALKFFSDSYYEAADAGSGVTVSVTTQPDGSALVSYTGKQRANGICRLDG